MGLPRDLRLTRRQDFEAVYQRGRSWANRFLVLRALPNDLPQNRYGFAVGKGVGMAVVRNKVKRRLREAIRGTAVRPGWDIVITARRSAAAADFHTLNAAMIDLLRQSHLLAPKDPLPVANPHRMPPS